MLANNKLIYTTIAFQLTRKCNASCKICCESSSPNAEGKLDLDVILKAIESVKDIKNIGLIALTGGEPFLYPDEVLSIAKQCKKTNRQFSLATNAFWCKSYIGTFNIVSKLLENNLAVFFISADAFHQEYIPIENVRNLLRVCSDLKIPVKIQTNSTKSTFKRTREIINELGSDLIYTEVLFAPSYPVGIAKEQLSIDDFFTRELSSISCPHHSILYVATDGRIQPCCSPCCVDIPFEFGNIHTNSIQDLLKQTGENSLMRMIVYEGFSRLLEEAEKKLGFSALDKYVDVCHLCNHLLSDNYRYKYLSEKAEVWEKHSEVIANKVCW